MLNGDKTHCKRGHILAGDNLGRKIRYDGSGKFTRICKACLASRERIARLKRKNALAEERRKGTKLRLANHHFFDCPVIRIGLVMTRDPCLRGFYINDVFSRRIPISWDTVKQLYYGQVSLEELETKIKEGKDV